MVRKPHTAFITPKRTQLHSLSKRNTIPHFLFGWSNINHLHNHLHPFLIFSCSMKYIDHVNIIWCADSSHPMQYHIWGQLLHSIKCYAKVAPNNLIINNLNNLTSVPSSYMCIDIVVIVLGLQCHVHHAWWTSIIAFIWRT